MNQNIKIDTETLKTMLDNINSKLSKIELLSNDLSSIKQTFYPMGDDAPKLNKQYTDFENSITLAIAKLKKLNNYITINVINSYNKIEESMRSVVEDLHNKLSDFD